MKSSRRYAGLIVTLVAFPGCMNYASDGAGLRLREGETEVEAPVESVVAEAVAHKTQGSTIIDALRARPSLLIPDTPYAKVAEAVIASDSRVAEAELHVAVLRAEAASRNWMPVIGPRVSLTSLGDIVADLVIQQVVFDNGRKVAEREIAKADVEIAAVAIVEDGNDRVYEALSLYLKAEEYHELRNHLERSLREMAPFELVMRQRVDGGVSDMSDLNVLQQQLASMRARAGEAGEVTMSAFAELNAMSSRTLDGLTGLGGLRAADVGTALPVLRAQAERDKTWAKARMSRASYLPGLAINASAGEGVRLNATSDLPFGLGSIAAMKAIEGTTETADRRVAEADEKVRRQISAQTRSLAAYRRQAQEARGLTISAKQNLQLFQTQFEGGQRPVMDVVGAYETFARALETEVTLKYKAARAELELARLSGGLAEGARI